MLKMQRRLDNVFCAIISLPSTAMGFAISIQIMAMSWLLNTKYDLKIDEIGIVWAAGPAAGILGQVFIGLISDKVWFWGGRRRPFVLAGGTLTALMLFLLPRIDMVSHLLGISNILIVAVMVAMTLDLCINISFNPTRAVIADVTPSGVSRTRGYAWMQTISGFWSVMAYLIGAYLDNYILIDAGVALVFLFSVVPVFFIVEPHELATEPATDVEKTATDWGQLWRIYIAHSFSWMGAQNMFVYVIAFIQQHLIPANVPPADIALQSGQIIGISFAVMNTIGFLLPAFVLAPLAHKIGRVRTQVFCVGTMALGYFLIALVARTPLMMYLLMIVVGVGWSAIVSLPFAIMSETVDKSRMGFFMGTFNLSVVLPQLVVSFLFGTVILKALDKSIVFILSGVCLMISAALWCWVREKK